MGDNDGMMAGPVAELLNAQQFAGVNGAPTMGPEGLTGTPQQSIFEPSIGPYTPAY